MRALNTARTDLHGPFWKQVAGYTPKNLGMGKAVHVKHTHNNNTIAVVSSHHMRFKLQMSINQFRSIVLLFNTQKKNVRK